MYRMLITHFYDDQTFAQTTLSHIEISTRDTSRTT